MENQPSTAQASTQLAHSIKQWAKELGFQDCRITGADPKHHAEHYQRWLQNGLYGEMDYMRERESLRLNPSSLHSNTHSVISLRMDYRQRHQDESEKLAGKTSRAFISQYALGRDYHKLMRKRLSILCKRISAEFAESSQRPFVDSAPVLERGFAELAGLGWIGKNTMLIHQRAGSWFFLGEIYTDLKLPQDIATDAGHCGSCQACLDACPTQAFIGPNELDARRCISYLTIELKGSIPEEFREPIGNRIFGCDDCQIVCPWNKFSDHTSEADFEPRHRLDKAELLELFNWTEAEFEENTQGSPIRRIGYERWLRNIAVALGNGPADTKVIAALKSKRDHSVLIAEHADWAIKKLELKLEANA